MTIRRSESARNREETVAAESARRRNIAGQRAGITRDEREAMATRRCGRDRPNAELETARPRPVRLTAEWKGRLDRARERQARGGLDGRNANPRGGGRWVASQLGAFAHGVLNNRRLAFKTWARDLGADGRRERKKQAMRCRGVPILGEQRSNGDWFRSDGRPKEVDEATPEIGIGTNLAARIPPTRQRPRRRGRRRQGQDQANALKKTAPSHRSVGSVSFHSPNHEFRPPS